MPLETHPLDSPYGKMLRAVQHMDALENAIATWVEQTPYRLLHQFEPQTGWNRWVVANRLPMPALIPLIFGDYVGCLRASLDHLVAAIVRLQGKTPTTSHQFPILHKRAEWGKRMPSALADVPSDVVDQIEALQPYHHPSDPNRHRIAVLNNFANTDKHRLIRYDRRPHQLPQHRLAPCPGGHRGDGAARASPHRGRRANARHSH